MSIEDKLLVLSLISVFAIIVLIEFRRRGRWYY
jgi:hypothetical protein